MDRDEVIKILRARAAASPGKRILITYDEAGHLTPASYCAMKEVRDVNRRGQFVKGVYLKTKCQLVMYGQNIGRVRSDDVFNEEGFTFAPSTFIAGYPPEETKMENEAKDKKKPYLMVESEGKASDTDVYVMDGEVKTSIPFVQEVICRIGINTPLNEATVKLVMPKVKFKATRMDKLPESIVALFNMLPLDAQELLVEKLAGDVMKAKVEPKP